MTPWLFTLKRSSRYAVMIGDQRIGTVTRDRLTATWFVTDSAGVPVWSLDVGTDDVAFAHRQDAVNYLLHAWSLTA